MLAMNSAIPTEAAITDRPRDRASRSGELWKALYYFNLYRLVLAGCLLTLSLAGTQIAYFGERFPTLFFFASAGLAVMGVINIITINRGRPTVRTQAQIQITADLALISLLMHASGGVPSGLGLLLVVSVAAGGVVLSGRGTLLNAAIASVLVLLEHALNLIQSHPAGGYTQVGLLGVGLFTIGLAVYILAHRIRRTEALAYSQAIDIANLGQVNELIVEQLETGIVVTDQNGQVRHINHTARRLLDVPDKTAGPPIAEISPVLAHTLDAWQARPGARIAPIRPRIDGPNVTTRILPLGEGTSKSALIFLEDSTAMEKQAQQLKLAALGRLSAAIAHEIRNPLAAVSHASQLLAETGLPDPQSERLVKIVQDQSVRINEIIESVLQLGRRGGGSPVGIELNTRLADFARSFTEVRGINPGAIEVSGPLVTVQMDPGHLTQVLTNLCENAIRYSPAYHGEPLITLVTQATRDGMNTALDVIDHGTGIEPNREEEIFEPFFTTDAKGTGLGLYVARDLCEVNQGRLDYFKGQDGGCRFRITFGPEELSAELHGQTSQSADH